LKSLLDPGGRFVSEAKRRLLIQIYNGYRGHNYPRGRWPKTTALFLKWVINYKSVTLIQGGLPGYFIHVSLTTHIVSALKKLL
jgi:hypothetical protein